MLTAVRACTAYLANKVLVTKPKYSLSPSAVTFGLGAFAMNHCAFDMSVCIVHVKNHEL